MTPSFTDLEEASRALGAPLFADLSGDIAVSFEFFPPASDAMATKLWSAIETLAPLGAALRFGDLWRRRIDARAYA